MFSAWQLSYLHYVFKRACSRQMLLMRQNLHLSLLNIAKMNSITLDGNAPEEFSASFTQILTTGASDLKNPCSELAGSTLKPSLLSPMEGMTSSTGTGRFSLSFKFLSTFNQPWISKTSSGASLPSI